MRLLPTWQPAAVLVHAGFPGCRHLTLKVPDFVDLAEETIKHAMRFWGTQARNQRRNLSRRRKGDCDIREGNARLTSRPRGHKIVLYAHTAFQYMELLAATKLTKRPWIPPSLKDLQYSNG